MLINILVCILAADFITGLVHFWEDTYSTINDGWLSRNIGQPNILHHKSPLLFTMTSVISRNYIQWVAALIVLGLAILFGFYSHYLLLIAILSSMANEVHNWSHSVKNNWLVELLQDMCILQTKQHHMKHHKKPYDKHYCILTNWLNPVLDRIRFWRFLEWAISPIVSVKRGHSSREGY